MSYDVRSRKWLQALMLWHRQSDRFWGKCSERPAKKMACPMTR